MVKMVKSTFHDEVTLISEEIKSVVLSILKLFLPEGTR